jgi:hypothetical protein
MYNKILKDLSDAIRRTSTDRTTPYDTPAEVVRVEDGIAWVHIPGGVTETPVQLTIDAKAGDRVQVRVGGGRAWLTGNASAPPTDDTKAKQVAESVGLVSKAVHIVEEVANRAARIAGNTAQYFWFTETGTDTGAHITEIPQEEFLADPEHGGGNLLARSNGIAMRNGLRELTIINADGMQVYSDTSTQMKIAHLGYGAGKNQSGGQSNAPFFSLGPRNSSSNFGNYSVAAGYHCDATDFTAFAEGHLNVASGRSSHAEGASTTASEFGAHSEGNGTTASGYAAHAEGADTVASGYYSHAGGHWTIAAGDSQTAIGRWNVKDEDYKYAFIIGNGRDSTSRSNAFAVTWDGDVVLGKSPITIVNGSSVSVASGATKTIAKVTLDKGNYILTGVCRFSANASGYRTLLFSASGNSTSAFDRFAVERVGASQDNNTYLQITWPVEITADGTTIYLNATQSSGSTLTADSNGIKVMRVG